jgi:hypothetical protein
VLVAAAVCPHPPVLVPEVAAGLAAELEECRGACRTAIAAVLAAEPDLLVLVGSGTAVREHAPDAVGSLHPYGLRMRLGSGDGPVTLPLSLGIGRWLLDGAHAARPPALVLQEICGDAAVAAATGAALADRAERVGMIVLGDGSGYPSQTPVGDDGRGDRYDAQVLAALAGTDPKFLLDLDPDDDRPLWVAGRPAWQVLAGAVVAGAAAWRGAVLWRGAPYGVGYFVVLLEPRPDS